MKTEIIPFCGYGDFHLLQTVDAAKAIAGQNQMQFSTEVWPNTECSNPVPWTILRIEGRIHLFFAKNRLFKIYLDNHCPGRLPNGIYIGMSMVEAAEIDPDLKFDDWEEDFQSPEGYWIEDDLDSNTVSSISIFIREAMNDDLFDRYEWT